MHQLRPVSRRTVTTAALWSVPVVTVASAAPAFAASLASSSDLYVELFEPEVQAFASEEIYEAGDAIPLAIVVGNRGGAPVAGGAVLTVTYEASGGTSLTGFWPAGDEAPIDAGRSNYVCEDLDYQSPTAWGVAITLAGVTLNQASATVAWNLPEIPADTHFELYVAARTGGTNFPEWIDEGDEGDEEVEVAFTLAASVVPRDADSEFDTDNHHLAAPSFSISRRRITVAA